MTDAEFIGTIVIVALPIIASVISLIKPILNLTRVMTELTDNIKSLKLDGDKRDHRLDVHGQRLDDIEITVNRHDVEIAHLKHEVDRRE